MVHRSLHPTVGRHWSQPELRLPRVNPLLRPPSAQIDPKNGFVVSHSSSPSSFPFPSSAAAGGTPPRVPWTPLLPPPHAAGRARAAQGRATARASAARASWCWPRPATPLPGPALAAVAAPPPCTAHRRKPPRQRCRPCRCAPPPCSACVPPPPSALAAGAPYLRRRLATAVPDRRSAARAPAPPPHARARAEAGEGAEGWAGAHCHVGPGCQPPLFVLC